MKKLLILSFLFVSVQVFSQDFDKIANTTLKAKKNYKDAEPDVKKCADFLFKTPNKPETNNRKLATSFIVQWMSGTPDYSFKIDSNAMDLTKGNQKLFGMFMVALTKVSLDNTDEKLSDSQSFEKASELLAEYCSNKENKLKPSRVLKKLYKKMQKK
jgi:hypothetical protein